MSTDPKSPILWAIDVDDIGISNLVEDVWPTLSTPKKINYRWVHINLDYPNADKWISEFLPEDAVKAQLQKETRPRCELLSDGITLNFRGVNLNNGEDVDDMISIRVWVTESLIVTTELRRLKSIDELYDKVRRNAAPACVSDFIAELVLMLSKKIEALSVSLDDRTDELENILETSGVSDIELAQLRRKTSKLYRYIAPQSEALKQLLKLNSKIISESSLNPIVITSNQLTRTLEELSSVRERLKIIADYQDTQHAKRQSHHSNVLSIVAAIFLPLGFLTGLFGVNVGGVPGLDWSGAFLMLTICSAVIGVVLLMLFKWLKWL